MCGGYVDGEVEGRVDVEEWLSVGQREGSATGGYIEVVE